MGDPVIDVDKPLTVTVPGCTYYRKNCLVGDYYLLVLLLNSEKCRHSRLKVNTHGG